MSDEKTKSRPTKRPKAAKKAVPKTSKKTPAPARLTAAAARAARSGQGSTRDGGSSAPRLTPDAARDFASHHRAPLIAVVVAVFVVVALYGPFRSLYQAWRDNGMLLEQQVQTDEESAELEGDINSLMTEDGIKDEARERGYVESGETRIVVEGLDAEDDASADEQDGESGTPWYLRVTDFLFQYEAQS